MKLVSLETTQLQTLLHTQLRIDEFGGDRFVLFGVAGGMLPASYVQRQAQIFNHLHPLRIKDLRPRVRGFVKLLEPLDNVFHFCLRRYVLQASVLIVIPQELSITYVEPYRLLRFIAIVGLVVGWRKPLRHLHLQVGRMLQSRDVIHGEMFCEIAEDQAQRFFVGYIQICGKSPLQLIHDPILTYVSSDKLLVTFAYLLGFPFLVWNQDDLVPFTGLAEGGTILVVK
mmetsp:Transcript_15808/g.36425  ORF Transcript_15808/g.36425 Transcript_15808/m.36425 type:complete len:227 (+) Transcript_15808:512-1192(+)